MTKTLTLALLFLALLFCSAPNASAQTTEFNFQGSLKDGAALASGNYDFEFALYDAVSVGSQIGVTIPRNSVAVTSGIFSVKLDFGAVFPGANRFLEIRVRLAGQPGFTTLAPRQLMNSSPYSVKSLNSETATNATQLGGVAANQFVVTTDPRLSDPRNPLPGSGSYIQNTTTTQALSNFNISGTGRADIFDAGTQFNISGFRVFSAPGTGLSNTFAGYRSGNLSLLGTQNTVLGYLSGESLTTGSSNAFFGMGTAPFLTTGAFNTFGGTQAGYSTIQGSSNSFFGSSAGYFNVTGDANAYFGHSAGRITTAFNNSFFGAFAGENTTSGEANTFIGYNAGTGNATGSLNTAIGRGSGFTANNFIFATAIGAEAKASSSNSITLGRANGTDAVSIPGALSVTGVMTALSNFNIIGNSVVGGTISASTLNLTSSLNFNGFAFARAPSLETTFVGTQAGGTGSTGERNSFFGSFAGQLNTTGGFNSMFGTQAGFSTSTGSENAFFGVSAGAMNTTASNNSFFGAYSGFRNTTAGSNSFFGYSSGAFNTIGANNSFFGGSAGGSNNTGGDNSAFGTFAGSSNTGGGLNSYFGFSAGNGNTIENANTFIGAYSKGAVGVTNSTAVGVRSLVESSHSLVLGAIAGQNGALTTTNVGIGTTTPSERLHVVGNSIFTGNLTASGTVGTGGLTVNGVITVSNLGGVGLVPVCYNLLSQIAQCSSSVRYKTNIRAFGEGLSFVKKLRPISFDWKDGGMKDVGFGAEDIAKIDPRFVNFSAAGEVEGVKYDRIGVVLVNAVKEQQAQIEAQRVEIDLLKAYVCSQNPAAPFCKPQK